MTVRPLDASGGAELDVPLGAPGAPLQVPPEPADAGSFAGAVARAFESAGAALTRADAAERSFAGGRGGLQEMMLERAQADVALSIAAAAASKTAQALSTVLGMQV